MRQIFLRKTEPERYSPGRSQRLESNGKCGRGTRGDCVGGVPKTGLYPGFAGDDFDSLFHMCFIHEINDIFKYFCDSNLIRFHRLWVNVKEKPGEVSFFFHFQILNILSPPPFPR